MIFKNIKHWPLVALAVVGTACGAVSNGTDKPIDDPTPGPGSGGGLTIFDLQDASSENYPGSDTVVSLDGVIVTAILPDEDRMHFWVSEPEGGKFSGIYGYDQNGLVPASIQIGDEVNISATYTEYNGLSELVFTEAAGTVEVTNTGLTPPITSVASADLGTLATGGSQAEDYEGVLVQIDGTITVENAQLNNYGEFSVSNGSEILAVDDYIYADAEKDRFAGQEISNLRGILHYAFEEFKLEPRGADDLNATVATPVTISVFDIQDETSPNHPQENTPVEVSGVVTAVVPAGTGTKHHFFISDPAGGAYSGIYVYDQGSIAPGSLNMGDHVVVKGNYKEYYDKSEIVLEGSSSEVSIVTTGQVVPMTIVAAANLGSIATGGADAEKYEGVLVQVDMSGAFLSISVEPNTYGEFTVSNGTDDMQVDDYLFDGASAGVNMASQVSTLVGILDYSYETFELLPRSPADFVLQ